MAQLGGIKWMTRTDRALCREGFRFGFRTVPRARRSRRRCAALAVVCVLLGVAVMVGSLSDGTTLGLAVGVAAALLGGAVYFSLLASSRYRSWAAARHDFKDLPDEHDAVCRVDEAAYSATGAGRSVQLDWSVITSVVEGDRFLALAVGRTQFVSAPIGQLSDVERATIRRWAEAAPGGPRWTVRRSNRTSPRLRVSPSPASLVGSADVASVVAAE